LLYTHKDHGLTKRRMAGESAVSLESHVVAASGVEDNC
jgi:hypothetical protein